MTVLEAWNKRRELRAEGKKLQAEGSEMWAVGSKLRVEGNIIFYDAVTATHGNVEITWDGNDAIVCGVRYTWKEPETPSCEGKVVEIDGKKYRLTEVK